MRVTTHNGRAGKDGSYSSKHNDRNFDLKKAPHIHADMTSQNKEWKCIAKASSFEECEKIAYEILFRKSLDARNARYIEQRHPERCKTMDAYRTDKRTCPEETLLYIGNAAKTVDPNVLWDICTELISWESTKYPNVRILDVALHVDEDGAPHLHERKVWVAHNDDGDLQVGQAAALREMGVQAPNPNAGLNRHNNPKMTYTADVRAKMIELCQARGLDITVEPREPSQSGLSLLEYKTKEQQANFDMAQMWLKQFNGDLAAARQVVPQTNVKDIEPVKRTPSRKKFLWRKEKPATIALTEKDYNALKKDAEAAHILDSKAFVIDRAHQELTALGYEIANSEPQQKVYQLQKETHNLKNKIEELNKTINDLSEQLSVYEQLESQNPDIFSFLRNEQPDTESQLQEEPIHEEPTHYEEDYELDD